MFTHAGVQIALMLGTAVPRPAPPWLAEAVERVEVLEASRGPSAFQITLSAGRTRTTPAAGSIFGDPALAAFSRVVVLVRSGLGAEVLLDGVITHRQLVTAAAPGQGTMAVTGEDLTVRMDLEERVVSHAALSDPAIAGLLIGRYAQYGIVPRVVPAAVVDQPLPIERVPVQRGTDLAHLQLMAARAHHVFVLRPGPLPLTSVAYWGPAAGLAGRPLPALSVGTGSPADVLRLHFVDDALAPQRVTGLLDDASSAAARPLIAMPPQFSPLSRAPEPPRRTVLATGAGGLPAILARSRAQARADASSEEAVVAEGELDVASYGAVLQPHRLVGVRGAGAELDGMYRVDRVTHLLERGSYLQRFRLTRPGVGTTTAVVPTAGRAEG